MTRKSKKKGRRKTTIANPKKKLKRRPVSWRIPIIMIFLLTFAAYHPILEAEFINYDDDIYITENSAILDFNFTDFKNLFTSFIGNQYSPVAMTIMGLEVKLLGLRPGPLKLISIILHLINTLLVFKLLRLLFTKPLLALIPAGIFALHPLQVEAVAWLTASMKIGSYTLFSLLSLYTYVLHLKKDSTRLYYFSILFFLLSCFCKEQALILPFVLLLIDYVFFGADFIKWKWRDKIPYFIISGAFILITLSLAEAQSGALSDYYGILHRALFACTSVILYFIKFVVPSGLSPFYVYPVKTSIPFFYYFAPLFIVGIAFMLYHFWKRDKRVPTFAILFFVINMALPLMTQIMSVRDVMMADRYMYLPIVGIGLLFGYGLLRYKDRWGKMITYGLVLLGLACAVITYERCQIWENSVTIFTDAIEKGSSEQKINPFLSVAYNNRGIALKRSGRLDEALVDYNRLIATTPEDSRPYVNRGNIYQSQKKYTEALRNYNSALELDPESETAFSSRGALYATQGKFNLALQDFNRALELKPVFKDALSNRIKLYDVIGRKEDALKDIAKYYELFGRDSEIMQIEIEIRQR